MTTHQAGEAAGDASRDLLEQLPPILQGFVAFDNTELDAAIGQVVSRLGSAARVDRAYVFQTRETATGPVLDNTHEWCASGITPQRDQLQGLPMDLIDAWRASFEAQDTVYIPRVSDLPTTRPDREILLDQEIQSLVATPLTAAGRFLGFLGFDAVRSERSWTRAELLLLEVISDAVCGALLRQEALAELSLSEQRYRLLARHSSDLVVTIGPHGRFIDVAPSAADLLGWSLEDALGSLPVEHVHPEDWRDAARAVERVRARRGTEVELPDLRLRHQDGTWRWMSATAIDLSDEPAVGGLVVIGHDITERKHAEEALSTQAVTDPLTGLANRTLLLDRLRHALDRRDRDDRTVGVLFLDLDRFKVVNDSLGHAAGDEVLCAYARQLRQLVRAGDSVARFGGDEFVVVFEDVESEDQAWQISRRLLADLQVPLELGGASHRITASAGLVVATPGVRAEALLRDADAAMHQAKARGRDRIVALDDAVRRSLLEETELVRDLQGVVERDELTVEYQPIFELATDRCVGYEALARWHHPDLGQISPGRFIPLAEEFNAIGPIGTHVLERAVQQLLEWDRRFPGHGERTMAVNLSVRQLVDDDLLDHVDGLLSRTGLEPSRLELELTESALMLEPEAGRRVLARLRELGVRVAIDDFGTGYSSLASLRGLPVSTLKVDRSFVSDLGRDPRGSRVVAVVLHLAEEFGLRSVAEGVETDAQRLELARLGCGFAQGFGLAVPAPPEVLEAQTFMPIARSSSRT